MKLRQLMAHPILMHLFMEVAQNIKHLAIATGEAAGALATKRQESRKQDLPIFLLEVKEE
jgi:hypothetical protein